VPVTLSGVVYADPNNTGDYVSTDTGLAGVNVVLAGTNDKGQAVSVTVVTNASGGYSFTGVLPGTYSITYGVPAGYVGEAAAQDQLPPGATAISEKVSNIVVTSGKSVTINLPEVTAAPPPVPLS
jgi:hypothetical protein